MVSRTSTHPQIRFTRRLVLHIGWSVIIVMENQDQRIANDDSQVCGEGKIPEWGMYVASWRVETGSDL